MGLFIENENRGLGIKNTNKITQDQFKELLHHIYMKGEKSEKIYTTDMIMEIKRKLKDVLEISH